MNKQTQLIRQIMDAATADKLQDAVKAINEYVKKEVVDFYLWDEKQPNGGEHLMQTIQESFDIYLDKTRGQ